jgi:hypothetical protein
MDCLFLIHVKLVIRIPVYMPTTQNVLRFIPNIATKLKIKNNNNFISMITMDHRMMGVDNS